MSFFKQVVFHRKRWLRKLWETVVCIRRVLWLLVNAFGLLVQAFDDNLNEISMLAKIFIHQDFYQDVNLLCFQNNRSLLFVFNFFEDFRTCLEIYFFVKKLSKLRDHLLKFYLAWVIKGRIFIQLTEFFKEVFLANWVENFEEKPNL